MTENPGRPAGGPAVRRACRSGGSGRTRTRAAPAARRRATQHRRPAGGGQGRLRHLRRGRAREGDRRPGRRRRRHAVPALPAALGPGQGRASARDRCLRRRGPGAGRRARAGSSPREVAPPLHRVPRDQARTRHGPSLRRSGVRRPARLLHAATRARPRVAARRSDSELARSGPTSAPGTSCTPSPHLCLPVAARESRTASAWSRCSSTGCATAPLRARPAPEAGPGYASAVPAIIPAGPARVTAAGQPRSRASVSRRCRTGRGLLLPSRRRSQAGRRRRGGAAT